jgi:hypothetical protein
VGVSKDDPVCISSEESSDMDKSQDGLVNTTPGESSANDFDFELSPYAEKFIGMPQRVGEPSEIHRLAVIMRYSRRAKKMRTVEMDAAIA